MNAAIIKEVAINALLTAEALSCHLTGGLVCCGARKVCLFGRLQRSHASVCFCTAGWAGGVAALTAYNPAYQMQQSDWNQSLQPAHWNRIQALISIKRKSEPTTQRIFV